MPCKSTAEEVSFEWSHHRISSMRCKKKVVGLATGNVDIEYIKAASPAFLSLLGQFNGTQCAYRSASSQRCYKNIIHRHGLKVSRS